MADTAEQPTDPPTEEISAHPESEQVSADPQTTQPKTSGNKFIRGKIADIYEKHDYGNESINDSMNNLISDLTTKLKKRSDIDGQCEAYNKLGIAYYRLLQFDKAEICHQEHLLLSLRGRNQGISLHLGPRGSKVEPIHTEKKIALVNLGCTFHAVRENELALEAYKEGMDIAVELEDKPSQARILANMSNVYQSLYDLESAIQSEEKRMSILEEICDPNGQIKCACTLGSLYQLIGDTRGSIVYYEKAVINLQMKTVTLQLQGIENSVANEIEAKGGE